MTVPRFTLKTLLLATAFLAAVCAALVEPWRGWRPALVLTAAVLMLLLAVPAAIYAPRASRPYYVGFAAAGWGYLLLAFSPWFTLYVGRQMIAAPVAEWLCFELTGSLADWEQFLKVAHAVCLLAFSIAGGLTASRLHAAATREQAAADRKSFNPEAAPTAFCRPRMDTDFHR